MALVYRENNLVEIENVLACGNRKT